MRTIVETSIKKPNFVNQDPRRERLYVLDRWLDGTAYDDIKVPFHRDSTPTGGYVPMEKRAPASRYALPALVAKQISRKLMAGRHKPDVTHDEDKVVVAMNKFIHQGDLDQQMMQTIQWGSVGSACMSFKLIKNVDQDVVLVTEVHRTRDLWPIFDATKELISLRIAYEVYGTHFIQMGVTKDVEGENIKNDLEYWFIRDLDRQKETHYQPMRAPAWSPSIPEASLPEKAKLEPFEKGHALAPFTHGLGFVPAQWFLNLSGGNFPEGACTYELALNSLVEYDYVMSQIGLGVKNASTPFTVIQGEVAGALDQEGKPIPRSPSRFLQFSTGRKDTEGISEDGGDAHLLEATGKGMSVGIKDYARSVKKDMIEMIAYSRKDPEKMTTAMSGRGMELVEEEFMDLVMEFRTCYLSNGYLKLLIKIGRAAIQIGHPFMKGITKEALKGLGMNFPQLHDMSAQEYQQFASALQVLAKAGILDGAEAHDLHSAQVDMPITSKREDATKRVDKILAMENPPPAPLAAKPKAAKSVK